MNLVVVALTPIFLLIFILLVFRRPLFVAAPIVFIYTSILTLFFWGIEVNYFFASLIKSVLVSLDIILIVFGAILFLEYLKSNGLIKKIESRIAHISSDRRVQAIIIIWFFGSFIEGTAGFGTPAAITAPFLVVIGFPAILAVILALIGNSAAVVFGAVGTPIRVGFSGIESSGVGVLAAFINLFAGLIVPILIIAVLVFFEKKPFKYFREAVPFALWSGLCFMVPYYLLSYLGPEFPSLLGSIIGLGLIVFTTRRKFLTPHVEGDELIKSDSLSRSHIDLIKDFTPYILLVFFLLIGKYILPSKNIVLAQGVSHNLSLFNPGFIFLLAILGSVFLFKHKFLNFSYSLRRSFKILFHPFIAIFAITSIVQLLILSSYNSNNYLGVLSVFAGILINKFYLVLSPVLGVFGSFLSGSATVSNILFAHLQVEAASILDISVVLVLALQVVGAGIGNMISLTNIVAAQATVNLKGDDLKILRGTIVPALIYLVLVIIIGLILSMFL